MTKSKKQLLEAVLEQLQYIHYHLERMEAFYMMANDIKEDEKTGAWIEHKEK